MTARTKLKKDGTPDLRGGRTKTTFPKRPRPPGHGPANGGGDKPAEPFTVEDAMPGLACQFNGDAEAQAHRVEMQRSKRAARAKAWAQLESAGAPTPLEVMTAAMARAWQDVADLNDAQADAGDNVAELEIIDAKLKLAHERAVDAAAKAAPYMHAKLSSTVLSGDKEKPFGITFLLES